MTKPRVIALYLPQYHPTTDNDEWWGKGFTEWTNVGKAKPLFRGHNQPKIPADLGYYDLRLPEAREAQVELAKEAGVEAFCYYHYWFGNGVEELERPFKEVVESGKPDFPFCLCWANESWYAKLWNMDGTVSKKALAEQVYPGDDDIIAHFNSLLPAFKDPRYVRVDGRLFFMLYMPLEYPEVSHFMEVWNRLAKDNNLVGFYFVGHLVHGSEITTANVNRIMQLGFDAVNVAGLFRGISKKMNFWTRIKHRALNRPYIFHYKDLMPFFITEEDNRDDVIPTITPNWDHTPRSGVSGMVVVGETTELFKQLISKAISIVSGRKEPIIVLKAWNEWGEGNYMEPDLKNGKAYIKALRETLDSYTDIE